MAKKEKFVCGNCRQKVDITDETCPHCKATLEPMEDAVKAKSVRDFKIGGASIKTYVDRLKAQLEAYSHGQGIGDKAKMSKAKGIIRKMSNDLSAATKE